MYTHTLWSTRWAEVSTVLDVPSLSSAPSRGDVWRYRLWNWLRCTVLWSCSVIIRVKGKMKYHRTQSMELSSSSRHASPASCIGIRMQQAFRRRGVLAVQGLVWSAVRIWNPYKVNIMRQKRYLSAECCIHMRSDRKRLYKSRGSWESRSLISQITTRQERLMRLTNCERTCNAS